MTDLRYGWLEQEEHRRRQRTGKGTHAMKATHSQTQAALVGERIAETQADLATLDATLQDFADEQTRCFAAQNLDTTLLEAIAEQQAAVYTRQEHLRARLLLLEGQLPGAETADAHIRSDAIVARTHELKDDMDTALSAYKIALVTLTHFVEEMVKIWAEASDLTAEQQFLARRKGATLRELADLAHLPDAEHDAQAIYASLRLLRLQFEHSQAG